MGEQVFLSVGSNQGDREEYLRFALKELVNHNKIDIDS